MGENFAWLSQKTEEKKVIKKVATPLFLHQPPPFRFILPFLQNISNPPPPSSDSIFGRSYLPPFKKGGGDSNYATWAENAVKFKLKLSKKNGRENQTKTSAVFLQIFSKL